MNNETVKRAADQIRILSAAMVEKAKSGHPGGAMGGADYIQILFSEFLTFDPDDSGWKFRDRFFLDPGHMSPMLYSVLSLCGKYTMDDLKAFRQWGSVTPGHPELDVNRGVENTSGPLGQGHAMAVGAAIAARFLESRFGEWTAHKIYSFISDGGIQEEISQGAGRVAGFLGLSNLILFYDSNDIQLSTSTSAVTREDTAMKYQSWGWRTITINGHDADEIRSALLEAVTERERPVLIIGKTVMGKGCINPAGESFEGMSSTHGQPISKAGASFEQTVVNLGGNPEDPFAIFPDVAGYYEAVLRAKRDKAIERKQIEAEWKQENPEAWDKLQSFFNEELPAVDWGSIDFKPGLSTREASGAVLSHFAEHIDNMVVMSADLANSDKTDGFLKKTHPFGYQDFRGAFLHVGVSELTMGALANGMALHGGVVPVCGTFFVFSDYMKPAVRMAALMELPIIYLWTHDAFRVGEDGPTHQPVEQEAQIRLMEKLRNHSGHPSMLVLRPADSAETVVAWSMALENRHRPTALLLSRQGIHDLPPQNATERLNQAAKAKMGGYVVLKNGANPVITLLGNGSEVATLVEAADVLLNEHGVSSQVVSIPSESLFLAQSPDYQKTVIPEEIPVFALTAGLPVTMEKLAGSGGFVWGLDHFGYSAPAGVLDQKFGFTAINVVSQVCGMLGIN
ncbi:MAG: transketolase [Bacteroidales bacterium]|nr:transketolase [Bacteroidales bacterium]